jgi:hypothetical protein
MMTGAACLDVLLNPLFWLVVVLVWFLYRRQVQTGEELYCNSQSPLRLTAVSLLYGVIGGLLGSLVMVICGVSLNELGIVYLWVVALVLMFFDPRFICFSYAGGIISVCYLLFGWPQVNVPSLIGLVAILHLVESLLIFISGHLDPLPVYTRNRAGQLVGAFNLQKFWPLPIVVLMMTGSTQQAPGSLLSMPDWWPLIRPLGAQGNHLVFIMIPVLAALGYGDLATTSTPQGKARHTSSVLALYSVVLLALAVLASHFPSFSMLAALSAPIGHELVIYLGRRAEDRGLPLYVPVPDGVMVLDLLRGSPAARAGLRSGDLIRRVGDQTVRDGAELFQAIDGPGNGPLDVLSMTGQGRKLRIPPHFGVPLGLITVPEPGDYPNVEFNHTNLLHKIGSRIFHR